MAYGNGATERLRDKTEHEVWLLQKLAEQQGLIEGKLDFRLRITASDDVAHVMAKHCDGVGAGEVKAIMDALAAYVFLASFKVLDMVVEWMLEENGIQEWKFAEKCRVLKTKTLIKSQLFRDHEYLYYYTEGLYRGLLPYRNTVIHHNDFDVSEEGVLRVAHILKAQVPYLRLNRDQLGSLARVVTMLVRALREDAVDGPTDKQFRFHLCLLENTFGRGVLQVGKRIESRGEPYVLSVKLTVPKRGNGFPADLVTVRTHVKSLLPENDVDFELYVQAQDGEKIVRQWHFPVGEVPSEDVLDFSDDAFLDHRQAQVSSV